MGIHHVDGRSGRWRNLTRSSRLTHLDNSTENMKFTLPIAFLASLIAAVNASPDAMAAAEPAENVGYGEAKAHAGDWGKWACGSQHPAVQDAIQKFCNGNKKIVAPGAYSKIGAKTKNAWVRIEGTCSPPQYVPWDICYKQFYPVRLSANGWTGDVC